MPHYASGAIAVAKTLERLVRDDRGRIISLLTARLRNFQLAEEALQDALVSAVTHWSRNGLPDSPASWLITVASRKAIDRMRKQQTAARFAADPAILADELPGLRDDHDIPDERLRLMFMCCHPALELKSQVALTLRMLGGLSTEDIARVFLDPEKTMGQRISRAKAKIAAARIPFVMPQPEEWPRRLDAVLAVIYLIYTAGYTAGPQAGDALAAEAIFLARLLNALCENEAEAEGCLALILITHARRDARVDADGVSVALPRQNRALWRRDEIDEGMALIERAMARRKAGPYQIKAAIAACHSADGVSDWPQIVALYHALLRHEPTPVVRLNLAVAVAEAGALPAALQMLEALDAELGCYQPYHAARAELLARGGDRDGARRAYDKAIALAASEADRAFLQRNLTGLD